MITTVEVPFTSLNSALRERQHNGSGTLRPFQAVHLNQSSMGVCATLIPSQQFKIRYAQPQSFSPNAKREVREPDALSARIGNLGRTVREHPLTPGVATMTKRLR